MPPLVPQDVARRKSGREFALTLAAGFAFVSILALWRDLPHVSRVSAILAAVAIVAALVAPGKLGPARRVWMAFGEALGRVTTPVMLAIVYYLVLTPTGLLRRAFLGKPAPATSYWHPRPPQTDRNRMERQF